MSSSKASSARCEIQTSGAPREDREIEQPAPALLDQQSATDGEDTEKLPFGVRLRFSLPAFATTSLTLFISVYANDFYVILGTKLAFLSFFTALARSFDVITDPLMGWMSDRTSHIGPIRGRRRPYLMIGPIFYASAFTALFYPPPFWPNTPGDDKFYNETDPELAQFYYSNNVDGQSTSSEGSNLAAAYWFGAVYVLFYLTDTFTNVPYEALGPELTRCLSERSKLFFGQKLLNMTGMLTAATAPAMIAFLIRWYNRISVDVPCSYVYHPGAKSDSDLLHGTYHPDQLLYIDPHAGDFDGSAGLNKTAETCTASGGHFCFEVLYRNGSHYWFEQSIFKMESACSGAPDDALLTFDRFSTSSVSATQIAYVSTAALFGVYYVIFMLNLALTVKERPVPEGQKGLPLLSSIMRSLNNRAFRPLIIAWGLDGLGLAALVAMFPFYIRYCIRPDGPEAQANGEHMDSEICMAACVLVLLTTAIIGSPFWLMVSRRIGKFKAWQAFNFVNALSNLCFLFPGVGDSWLVIGVSAINGIPVGGQFLINAITSDVIDYDEFLNSIRSEGAFSVFATLIPKFVAIPASAIPLAVIGMLGFTQPINGVAQVQSESVQSFISVTFVLLPFTCAFLSFFVKFMYPIKTDETAIAVQAGIRAHKQGLPYTDPLTGRPVSVLHLTPAESYQTCLMESFTRQQLERYKSNLEIKISKYMSQTAAGSGRDHDVIGPGSDADAEDPQPLLPDSGLSNEVKISVITFATSTLAATLLTGFTFNMLEDQATSIIPIAGCICCGFSFCLLGINSLRLGAAKSLERAWHVAPPDQELAAGSQLGSLQDPPTRTGVTNPGVTTLGSRTNKVVPGSSSSPSHQKADCALDRLRHHVKLLGVMIELKVAGAAGGWLDTTLLKEALPDVLFKRRMKRAALQIRQRTSNLSKRISQDHTSRLSEQASFKTGSRCNPE